MMNASEYAAFLVRAGNAFGTNPGLLRAVHQLENSGRTSFDVNNWDSNARAGNPSAGAFQFIEPTFKGFARRSREANPRAWRGVPMDWRDPRAQALAASWAFANGKGSHWSTFEKAKGMAGGMPPAGAGVASGDAMGLSDDSSGMALRMIFGDSPIIQMAIAKREQDGGGDAGASRMPSVGGAEGKGFFARRKGETGQQYLDRLLTRKFGLKHDPGNTQTTGGRHTEGSLHYAGQATDFGNARNNPATLQAAHDWVNANRDKFVGGIAELLYGSGDHADHLHVATARSSRGGKRGSRFA